jgi:hypothetical protein
MAASTEVPHIPAAPAATPNGRKAPEDCAPCAEAKATRAKPRPDGQLTKGERIMGVLAVAGGAILILMGIDVASGFALSRSLGLLPAEDRDGN